MHDLATDREGCVSNQTYEDIQKYGPQGCGTWLAFPYFLSFMIILSMMIMNLFVAVVLEGFSESTKENEASITPQQYEEFVEMWSLYDEEGTGWISVEDLAFLLHELDPPLGRRHLYNESLAEDYTGQAVASLAEDYTGQAVAFIDLARGEKAVPRQKTVFVNSKRGMQLPRAIVIRTLRELDIPTFKGRKKIHYKDVVVCIAKYAISQNREVAMEKLNNDKMEELSKTWERVFPNLKRMPRNQFSSAEYYAVVFIQNIIRKIMIKRNKILQSEGGKLQVPIRSKNRKVSSNKSSSGKIRADSPHDYISPRSSLGDPKFGLSPIEGRPKTKRPGSRESILKLRSKSSYSGSRIRDSSSGGTSNYVRERYEGKSRQVKRSTWWQPIDPQSDFDILLKKSHLEFEREAKDGSTGDYEATPKGKRKISSFSRQKHLLIEEERSAKEKRVVEEFEEEPEEERILDDAPSYLREKSDHNQAKNISFTKSSHFKTNCSGRYEESKEGGGDGEEEKKKPSDDNSFERANHRRL
eukprot:CAMPEP_0115018076 /NCGR_PEP_ID=MMETSP0216-20121206/28549_1 /TAXON_ID=223996 /ORGANISM="Protocruzia adherens, Strain Boccale" /LENGTH=525 /DNA_ID=CAMNT_0002389119 /DNA_START=329 /DNA_END=1906 /DNA_ORIENTATION=-